jgi:hypothetical protein
MRGGPKLYFALVCCFGTLVVGATGCDDESSSNNGDMLGAGDGGGDGSANVDGSEPDLIGADLTCGNGIFPGFPGTSVAERSFDCSCGCTLDSFQNSTMVSGFWNGTIASDSFFTPTSMGLEATVDSSSAAPAIAGLSSILASNQWYLNGDFDLLVDYELVGPMASDGHAILQVNNLKSPVNSIYTLERNRTHAAVDQYTATLAGITPVSVSSSATSGTLELKRTGFVIQALADGNMVTQYTGGVLDRMAVIVTAALDGPCPLDGGAAIDGSVPGCRFTVKWKNLRLASGLLVDRQ